jgi:hypothetical protein
VKDPHAHNDPVELVLTYALALAGDEETSRALSSIELMKLAFLGDLAHAEANDGRSFTGLPWRFGALGPFSEGLYAALDRVIRRYQPEVRGREDDEAELRGRWVRLVDRDVLDACERALPTSVQLSVRGAMRRFRGDRAALLQHAFASAPMAHAAPGDPLSFSGRVDETLRERADAERHEVSPKAKKRAKQRFEERRAALRAKLAATRAGTLPRPKLTAADERVLRAGLAQMADDERGLSGEPRALRVTVDPSVWSERGKRDDEVL